MKTYAATSWICFAESWPLKAGIGPDLDDAKPSYDLVIERVTNGKSPMPSFKDKLSEKQIQDVAAYVFTSTHG